MRRETTSLKVKDDENQIIWPQPPRRQSLLRRRQQQRYLVTLSTSLLLTSSTSSTMITPQPTTLSSLSSSSSSSTLSWSLPQTLPPQNPTPTPDNHVSSAGKGILIGMLSAFSSAAFVAIIFTIVYFLRYTRKGRILLDRFARPGEFDDEQAFAREEADALEQMDDLQRAEYLRAKCMLVPT